MLVAEQQVGSIREHLGNRRGGGTGSHGGQKGGHTRITWGGVRTIAGVRVWAGEEAKGLEGSGVT